MQNLWKITQFILGFILGILLFTGVAAGITFFFLGKLAKTPPKPSFPETASKPIAQEQIVQEPEKTQEGSPVVEAEPEKEGYRAKVTWSDGLSVRAQPDINSERIGGVYYDQEVIVLETDPEQTWQRIRVPDTELEGWVKAGNLNKVE
jgi:hypothetical protein